MTSQKLKVGTRFQVCSPLKEQKHFCIFICHFDFNFWSLTFWRLPRGVYPERNEILPLHFIQGQNDRKRRARNDTDELPNSLLTHNCNSYSS